MTRAMLTAAPTELAPALEAVPVPDQHATSASVRISGRAGDRSRSPSGTHRGRTPTSPPRHVGPDAPHRKETDTADEILERRFATGEIDEEEYRSRKAALHRSS